MSTWRLILPKTPGSYYYGTRRFSDDAIDLICCCGLLTEYTPYELESLFTGRLNANYHYLDLSDVPASEIRHCFYQMYDGSHDRYLEWSRLVKIGEDDDVIESTLTPLIEAGLPYRPKQSLNQFEISIPNWTRQ